MFRDDHARLVLVHELRQYAHLRREGDSNAVNRINRKGVIRL